MPFFEHVVDCSGSVPRTSDQSSASERVRRNLRFPIYWREYLLYVNNILFFQPDRRETATSGLSLS